MYIHRESKWLVFLLIFVVSAFTSHGQAVVETGFIANDELLVKAPAIEKMGKDIKLKLKRGHRGKHGPHGHRGKRGIAGAQGINGLPGPQGPQGPAGSIGSTEFGYFSDKSFQTVPPGGDFTFATNNTNSAGIIHVPGTAPIILSRGGSYLVTYYATSNNGNFGPIALALNGVVIPTTDAGGDADIVSQAIITANAGDILTLRNDNGSSFTAANPGSSVFVALAIILLN